MGVVDWRVFRLPYDVVKIPFGRCLVFLLFFPLMGEGNKLEDLSSFGVFFLG